MIDKENQMISISLKEYEELLELKWIFSHSTNKPDEIYSSILNIISKRIKLDTYDLSIESYEKDIIEKCIDNIKNDITGYVFNNQQAREILDFLNQNQYKYKSEIKNGIYFFKKI